MKSSHKQKLELTAEKRSVLGRKVKALRKNGILPAVLYGKGSDALALQISAKDFERVFSAAGESTLVYLKVAQTVYPTIIYDVVRDPVQDTILHADFRSVRLDEKVKAKIPVVFEGESPAVKSLGGIFVRNINELEVEAFPQDLPHELTIDISVLKKIGEEIHVKDIPVAAGVKIVAGADDILAKVQEPISQEELEADLAEPTTDVSAVEEIKKEKEEEAAEEAAPEAAEKKE